MIEATNAETVMNFLLIRFAVLAGGVALLAVIAFTVFLVVRRKGKVNEARRWVEPVMRSWANSSPRRGRRGVGRATARGVIQYLDREDRR